MLIWRLASLDEPIQHIDLAMETANDMRDLLPQNIHLRNQRLRIVDAGNEDLILDGLGLFLCLAGKGLEAIDDVVTASVSLIRKGRSGSHIHHCIADPVAGQDGRVVHLADSISGPFHMCTAAGRESHHTILEHEHVQGRRDRDAWAILFDFAGDEGLEGDEVVVLEHVDLLPWLADGDILRRQGMDGQGLGHSLDVFLGGVAHVNPPDWMAGFWSSFVLLQGKILIGADREEIIPGGGGG